MSIINIKYLNLLKNLATYKMQVMNLASNKVNYYLSELLSNY